jgi:glycosyltransferase involved in cell wall biosynthesis
VGDGALRRVARARAGGGLGERIIFAGLVPPADIPKYVGVMDVVAHLSRREGLPRALPQALAAGRPVVAYDCDGANEVCFSGQTGFLIPVGDVKTLAGTAGAIGRGRGPARTLGRRGQEFVRENFAVETMVEKIHALYQKLARKESK